MVHPRPLFRLFSIFFKQTIKILLQINVKKCPTSVQGRDLNSQPFDYVSPLLTTRPGLLLRHPKRIRFLFPTFPVTDSAHY